MYFCHKDNTHNMKHIHYLIAILAIMFCTTSCEKGPEEELPTNTETPTQTDDDDDDDSEYEETDIVDGNKNNNQTNSYMTVAQFQEANLSSGSVMVRGYIVGACSKQISYAEWVAPFTYNQAILLADDPQCTDDTKVMSVQLKKGPIRNTFNLVDHPENLGRKVYVYGAKHTYLGIAGMKDDITGYGFCDGE